MNRSHVAENDRETRSDNSGRNAASSKGGVRLKLAEWITFALSCLIVLGVSGYLLYQALQPEARLITPRIEPQLTQVQQDNGHYILPVRVTNDGKRTLRDMKLEAAWKGPDRREESIDFTIDFLGEKSSQTVYFYFDQDPNTLGLEVRPLHYHLE